MLRHEASIIELSIVKRILHSVQDDKWLKFLNPSFRRRRREGRRAQQCRGESIPRKPFQHLNYAAKAAVGL